MLRLMVLGVVIFGVFGCTIRSPGPGEYGLQAWLSDPPETEEKCLQRVKREFWKRRSNAGLTSIFGINRTWFDPFGYKKEQLRFYAEQEAADEKKCRDHFSAQRAVVRSEATKKYGEVVSNSDPFGLEKEAHLKKNRPHLSANLTDLVPKPKPMENGSKIQERKLREYLESPIRGSAADVVSGFDYNTPGCTTHRATSLGC